MPSNDKDNTSSLYFLREICQKFVAGCCLEKNKKLEKKRRLPRDPRTAGVQKECGECIQDFRDRRKAWVISIRTLNRLSGYFFSSWAES